MHEHRNKAVVSRVRFMPISRHVYITIESFRPNSSFQQTYSVKPTNRTRSINPTKTYHSIQTLSQITTHTINMPQKSTTKTSDNIDTHPISQLTHILSFSNPALQGWNSGPNPTLQATKKAELSAKAIQINDANRVAEEEARKARWAETDEAKRQWRIDNGLKPIAEKDRVRKTKEDVDFERKWAMEEGIRGRSGCKHGD